MSKSWYSFQSGDPTNPANYLFSAVTPTCNSGTQIICAIYAPPLGSTSSHPSNFSANLMNYIGRATTLAEPAFPAVAKKYLYRRPGI
jgi:hypothetical protein